jgi:hypothetical protein
MRERARERARMGYEPELNDPVFYAGDYEEAVKCFRCGDTLDRDDIVWADEEGQIVKEGNDTAWCVVCLPNEGESNENA